jgi:hypothetical protein
VDRRFAATTEIHRWAELAMTAFGESGHSRHSL